MLITSLLINLYPLRGEKKVTSMVRKPNEVFVGVN